MRTILYHTYGSGADVLGVHQADAPAAPGANEVAVRVLARPVHHGDLLGVAGGYRSPGDTSDVPAGGKTPGFEGMGVIEAIGSGSTEGLKVGDRVAFFPVMGTWGEHVNAGARNVTLLDHRIPDEIGAQLFVNPITALMLLRAADKAGANSAGGTILLTAAGSAVAKLMIAIAGKRGLKMIAVVRRTAGRSELQQAFPGLAVVATDERDWTDHVSKALEGEKVRVVLDAVGGETASRAFGLLESGGALISYGDLSGEPMSLGAVGFSTRSLSISGVSIGGWGRLPDDVRQQDVAEAKELAIDHPELFRVASFYDLADVKQAAAHVHQVGKAGTVILTSR